MPSSVLISTFYSVEPVMVCATNFTPKKLIVLTEEDAPEEKKRAEQLLKDSIGKVMKIESKITSLYDVVRIARDTAAVIEKEHAEGNKITVNITGGRKPQALGALFGAYARASMVEKIIYITEEDQFILELPVLSFDISETKRMILEEIAASNKSVPNIARKAGISRGMAYNHVRELKEKGYVSDKEGLNLTTAGKLAII